jgi:hypothetical protein
MFPHSFMSYLMISLSFVIQNGNNNAVVNSICYGLFNRNCELYVEDEFDSDGVLIYNPPPLYEVWIDKAGCCKGKKDLLLQHCRNEDLVHVQHQDTCKRAGQTPDLTPPVTDNFPNAAIISDDDSVDSSVCSQHLQPEGEFRDDYDGNISFTFPSLLLL